MKLLQKIPRLLGRILCTLMLLALIPCVSASAESYIVEIVTGADGYDGTGTITVGYTDTSGNSKTATTNIAKTYSGSYYATDSELSARDTASTGSVIKEIKSWTSIDAVQAQRLAAGYTGNYYSSGNACLDPYTATSFDIALNNPESIDSVNVKLTSDGDSVTIQSLRVVKLTDRATHSYWNGGYSREQIPVWNGHALAVSKSVTISPKGSYTFLASNGTLNTDALGFSETNNNPTESFVSFVVADVAGAGIESLLAHNGSNTYTAPDCVEFPAMEAAISSGFYVKPYLNLDPIVNECLMLEIFYTDTWSSLRRVQIPFITTYLMNILVEDNFDFYSFSAGGIQPENDDSTTWISGIIQQGQEIFLPIRLAQFESLYSIRLVYGSAPSGLTKSCSGVRTIDTSVDTLSIDNLMFGDKVGTSPGSSYDSSGSSDVRNRYNSYYLGIEGYGRMYSYSYLAPTYKGSVFRKNSYLCLTVDSSDPMGVNSGYATVPLVTRYETVVRSYDDETDRYVFEIGTANIDTADTTDDLILELRYMDTFGEEQVLSDLNLKYLVSEYYGFTVREEYEESLNSHGGRPYLSYLQHLSQDGSSFRFMLDIPAVDHFISATLTLTSSLSTGYVDDWQMSHISIYKPTDKYLSNPRMVTDRYRSLFSTIGEGDRYPVWDKKIGVSSPLAWSSTQIMLTETVPSKTINLIYLDSDGNPVYPTANTVNPDYVDGLPTAMTYQDTLKNLGLAAVKYTYDITVNVANQIDAGSSNYFFFQLIFENGTSGVVLANQQLAADSFRQGTAETFKIKATQNYGDLRSVRIICDNVASAADEFDKLNIDSISVTLSGSSTVSKTWLVENIGWIDITYVDEGMSLDVSSSDVVGIIEYSNQQVVKEFPVTDTVSTMTLIFTITTTDYPDNSHIEAFNLNQIPHINAELAYVDLDGKEQTMSFNLVDAIKQFNGDNAIPLILKTAPNRFYLNVHNMYSLKSITLTPVIAEGSSPPLRVWPIGNISVQVVTGLGDPFVNFMNAYERPVESSTNLTSTTNENVVVLENNDQGGVPLYLEFAANSITLTPNDSSDSWDASISRVPETTAETLNIYIHPGNLLGQYKFTESSPKVSAKLKYTNLYGGTAMQLSVPESSLTLKKLNGENILCATGIPVSGMASITSMVLSADTGTSVPVISHAVVERIRNGVLVETTYINFANTMLTSPQERKVDTTSSIFKMHQVVQLQLAPNQDIELVAETADIAVALRYTTDSSPDGAKQVYRSPYIFLTDQEYNHLVSGMELDLVFEVGNVDQVIGLSVVSTGPKLIVDRALIYNYKGAADAANPTLIDTCSLTNSFTVSTMEVITDRNDTDILIPAKFTFTTASDTEIAGSGVTGQIGLEIHYLDTKGVDQVEKITDISSLLSAPAAQGSTTELNLMLPNAKQLVSVSVKPVEDKWFLSSLSATLTLTPSTQSSCDTTVNNWATPDAPLTVDIRPRDVRGEDEPFGNILTSLSVSGRVIGSGSTGNAYYGNTLNLQAHPGDVVVLTPNISATGQPDTSLSWEYTQGFLLDRNDGTFTFSIPHTSNAGDTYTLRVSCNAKKALQVDITITVVNPPEEKTEPSTDATEPSTEAADPSTEATQSP